MAVNFQRWKPDDLPTSGKFNPQVFPLLRQCLIAADVDVLHVSSQLEIKWLQFIGNRGLLSGLDLDTDKHPVVVHVDPMVDSRCLNLGILDRLPHFIHQTQSYFAVALVLHDRPFAMQSESDWFVNDFDFHCAIPHVIHVTTVALFFASPVSPRPWRYPASPAVLRCARSSRRELTHRAETEDCPSGQRTVRLLSPGSCYRRSAGTFRCASPTLRNRPKS